MTENTFDQDRVRTIKARSLKNTTIKINYFLLCLILCSIHIISLSVHYFEFNTIALFAPYIPFEQNVPFVTICGKLTSNVSHSIQVNQNDSSPLLKECKLRNFTSRQVETVNCAENFETTRSIREHVYNCYTIKSRVSQTYMILEALAVLETPRMLYSFILGDELSKYIELMPLMHFKRRPDSEFRFSRPIPSNGASKRIFFEVNSELIETFRLPAPYDTNCIDDSICLDQQGARYSWCKRALCITNVTLTHVRRHKTLTRGIFMTVMSLSSPSKRVAYGPEKRPSSFILEIVSLLGLWISFSIYMMTTHLISCISRFRSRAQDRKEQRVFTRTFERMRSGVDLSSKFQSINVSKNSPGVKRAVRSVKILLHMMVLILFAREAYLMSVKYFEYKTHVFINIQVAAMVEYPSISHCIDIYKWFNHEQPIRLYQSFDELMEQFFDRFNFTLREIFDLTPSIESTIDRCLVRFSSEKPLVTTGDCYRYFNVSKFYYGEFMCYFHEPTMQFIQPKSFKHDASVIFSIIPTSELIAKSHYQTIVSYGLPSQSRLLAKEQWVDHTRRQIDLTFRQFKLSQLPSPYDTNCGEYENPDLCESACMNLSSIGLVSFSPISSLPIDLPVLDYVHLKNSNIAHTVQRIQDKCKYACPRPCEGSFSSTVKRTSQSNYSHQLTLLSPKYPILYFHTHPVYTMYEYIYQAACSASFWIGLSAVGVLRKLCNFSNNRAKKVVSSAIQSTHKLFTRVSSNHYRISSSPKSCKMRRLNKRVTSFFKKFFFIIPLTIGYSVHTFIMASIYFEYPTCMDTRMVYNGNHTELKATVCISIDQLDLRGDYSLHNIWAQSPGADELMIECGYRGPQIPQLSHIPSDLRRRLMPFINSTSLCNILLRVRKFSTMGLICYQVTPGDSMTDPEYQVQYQIWNTGVFEYFVMSPRVSSYNLTIALSQGPSINALFLPTIRHHSWPNAACVHYYVYYVKYRITSLAHPYDMGVYDSLKKIMCMRNCLGPKMQKMRVFSPYSTAHGPNFLQHETAIQSIQPEAINVKSRCERACEFMRHLRAKDDVYFNTFSNGPHHWSQSVTRPDGTISIWLMTSSYLVTETTFFPEFTFVDLVIFIGSLFSVWFGLSALQSMDSLTEKFVGGSVESR